VRCSLESTLHGRSGSCSVIVKPPLCSAPFLDNSYPRRPLAAESVRLRYKSNPRTYKGWRNLLESNAGLQYSYALIARVHTDDERSSRSYT